MSDDILQLFRFIDWLLRLPDELEQQFKQQLATYEAQMSTHYITSLEQQGIEQGQKTLLANLARKHYGGTIADQLAELLAPINAPDRLTQIGEWLLEYDDGTTFIDRVRNLPDDTAH